MSPSPRLVTLYLRSRAVPRTLPLLGLLVVLAAWDVALLDRMHTLFAVVVALLAAVLLGGGLGTPSPELDATAPLPWWRWRLGHLLAGMAVTALPLGLAISHHYGSGVVGFAMIRNVLGLAGLTALTAVVAGARLSWIFPFIYVLSVRIASPGTIPSLQPSDWLRGWRWPAQPGDLGSSWWPALALLAAGIVLFAGRGAASRIDDAS